MKLNNDDAVALSDIAKPISDRALTGCTYPAYAVTKHNGMVPSADYFKKQIYSRDVEGYKIVRRGQFAYATIHLDEGSIGLLDSADQCIISPMYTVFEVDANRVHAPYLIKLLKTPWALSQYASMGNGSVHRRRSIPFEVLGRLKVRLPSIDEQKKSAAILDKSDGLRRKRQEAIRLADDLMHSVFVEMFGDPVLNTKQLPTEIIERLCPIGTGATPSRERADYFGGVHPWVKTGEVDSPWITKAEEHISDLAIRETNCKLFPARTVLVAMYGQGKTRGKVGMLGIPAATNQACAAILPSTSIDPFFLHAQLSLMYDHLRAMGRGGNQENLNLGMIKSLPVLVPAPEIVHRFLAIRQRTESIIEKARLAESEVERLAGALGATFLA